MIKVKYSILVGAVLAASLVSQAWAQQGVRWQPTLESAKRTAGQTNRLVLVHFWAEWCKPCAQMERDVFSRPDVAGAIEAGYVPVKVNVDHFPATVREYGVSIVPTDVLITSDGQLVDKLIGLADPTQYVARLNQIAQSRAPQANGAAQMAAAGPATNPYQQQPANPYANPARPAAEAQPAAEPSQSSDDRYADYFSKRSQPEPAAAAAPYANQWTPPADATAAQPPSYQIPTSPYQPEAASPYQAPSTPAYRNESSPYAANAASPYQAAPNKPAEPASPYGMNAAAPYQGPAAPSYQNPATPSYDAGVTSPYQAQAPAASPYAANATPPYRSPASPPYDDGAASPYQNQAPSYQQDVAAERRQQPASLETNRWAQPSTPPAETPLADQLPPGSPPLALDGFCPVRLAETEQWVKGDLRWGARHEGRTYLFAGPEEQQRFLAAPQQYAPALAGNDVVLAVEQKQMVPGSREHGVWYHGKVYLFSDEASCQRFNAAPDQYVNALEQNAGGMARRPVGASPAGSAWQTYGPANGGPY